MAPLARCPALSAWLLTALWAAYACSPAEPLPNTPESVVRQYQAWYDANRFDAAQKLSTPREGERLRELAGLLQGEASDSTLLETRFLVIKCETGAEVAYCYCLLEDEYERYQDLYTLRRVDDQWLVDSPEAEGPPAEDVQRTFDALMQALELETGGPDLNQ